MILDNEDIQYNAQLVTRIQYHLNLDSMNKKFNEYEILEEIGHGSFCKVKKVKRQFYDDEGQIAHSFHAAKIFKKSQLQQSRFVKYTSKLDSIMTNYLDQVYEEIDVWKNIDNPYIIKLYQINDDPQENNMYLIMELADLGQIMNWSQEEKKYERNNTALEYILNTHIENKYTDLQTQIEQVAKFIFKNVAIALQHLHNNLIVHRDIKVDNILVKTCNKNPIKLADFTTTCKLDSIDQMRFDIAGTPSFRNFESALSTDGYYPFPTDIWSLGVCIFCYVTEILPFYGESEIEMDIKSKNEDIDFKIFNLSDDLIDLLQSLLLKNSQNRPSIHQVLEHKWFQ